MTRRVSPVAFLAVLALFVRVAPASAQAVPAQTQAAPNAQELAANKLLESRKFREALVDLGVANQTDRTVDLFEVNRQGILVPRGTQTLDNMTPRTPDLARDKPVRRAGRASAQRGPHSEIRRPRERRGRARQ
jgi:hypothetical protein